jgi:hypothetical protein
MNKKNLLILLIKFQKKKRIFYKKKKIIYKNKINDNWNKNLYRKNFLKKIILKIIQYIFWLYFKEIY